MSAVDEIRTPDDEVTKAGYFYPPFDEGDTYEGVTYGGHTNFAVDWNKRTPSGAWLPDEGEPVRAAADGYVVAILAFDGTVVLQHRGGYRTEYKHMEPVLVKLDDRVDRGDIIGRIGDAGNAPNGTHLHHVHWKRDASGTWRRIKQSFLGVPVIASVWNSDTQPQGTNLPGPVYVKGEPLPATWRGAFTEAAAALTGTEALLAKRTEQRDEAKAMTALVTEERDTARRELVASVAKLAELQTWSQDLAERFHAQTAELTESKSDLATAGQLVDTLNARIAELEAATPQDCNAEVDRALAAEQKVADAITVLTR
jgi:hypothetical protein